MTGSSPNSIEPQESAALPESHAAENRQIVLMRTAAEIAKLAQTVPGIDDLLQQSVDLISRRFGFYQASIFLLDPTGQSALLQATAGQVAEQFRTRGARVVVGSRSVIGWVTAHNQLRVVNDVTQEFFFLKDELLGETRSEIALPLSMRSVSEAAEDGSFEISMLGALDVQHDRRDAFDPGTVTVLQTIANQIAAVIQNYRLLETTQRGLQEVSELYRASRDMARSRNAEDIRATLSRVLQVARYPALLLILQSGATSAEDQFIPYRSTGADQVITGAFFADGLPADLPALNYEQVDAGLRKVGAGSDGTGSEPTQPLADCLILDLASGEEATRYLPASVSDFARQLGFLSNAVIPVSRSDHLEMLLILGSRQEVLAVDMMQTYIGLADMARTALERASAIQMMDRRLTVLETLNTIGQAVAVQTDLYELFRVIHKEVKQLMGEVSFFIAIFLPDENKIEIPYLVEMGSEEERQLPPLALGEGMTSIVINTRQPLMLVENTEERSRELGAKLVGAPARSWLGVPLLVSGEVTGAIVIQDLYKERRFDEDDLRLMITLASQVAVSVRNTNLLEKTYRQAERERILNEITGQIRASSDAQNILQTATREVARALNARRARLEIDVMAESSTRQAPDPSQQSAAAEEQNT